jgi:hypothetical protein
VAFVAHAGWNDNFDSEDPAENTVPSGYNGVWGAGTLDKGITDLAASGSVSPPNVAYIAVGFDGNGGFRSILLHDEVAAMDLTGGTLSVQLSTDVDISSGAGVVGFHLYDANGAEFGTLPEDRFAPTNTFSEFTQNVSALTNVIAWGSEPYLDTTNIVRYALDIFDPSNGTQTVVFYIDDFKGTEKPIPPFEGDIGFDLDFNGNAIDLFWFAGYGTSYQLQYSEDLITTNWVDFGGVVEGNNETNHVTDPATNSYRFYKVKIIQ